MYATGTGSTVNDLIDAIRVFALSNGWTVAKWDSTSGVLYLSKGVCNVAIQPLTSVLVIDRNTDPSGAASVPDHRVRMSLSSGFDLGLSQYWGHPGSPCTSATDPDRCEFNDLTGPFVNWHLFSGNPAAGDPDYIHCVIQTKADRFQHFSFGNVDKGALSHSGAAYIAGMYSKWYKTYSDDSTNGADSHNYSFQQPPPFGMSTVGFTFDDSTNVGQVYAPDAMPLNFANNMFTYSGGTGAGAIANVVTRKANADNYLDGLEGRFIGIANRTKAPIWSGRCVLFPIPVVLYESAVGRMCYVGDYPNVRLTVMEGLLPGASLTLAEDEWIIFPWKRQTDWSDNLTQPRETSGHYAVAYKKVT